MIENIASEPINTPIMKPRRVKNARSTSGAPARDSTVSSSTSAAAASASGATTASGAVVTCGSACSVNTSDIIKVASRMKPIQSVRWSCAACAPAVAAPAGGLAGNGGQHQRNVEPEDQPPAGGVGDEAADERPDAEAEHQEARPRGDRPCPALRRRAEVDGGERARHQECRRQALQGAPGKQHGFRPGDRDEARGGAEQRHADHRGKLRTEPPRHLAAEHDKGGGDDEVGIDRPLDAGGAKAELAAHARQRRHDRGAVGANPEHRQARRPQHRR
jgi:hypothetical protein